MSASPLLDLDFPVPSVLGEPLDVSGIGVCGIQLHPVQLDDLHSLIGRAVARNEKCLVAHHNLHSLYMWHRELRELGEDVGNVHGYYRRASWTLIDGMSMVLLARLHGFSVGRKHRIAYNQTLPETMKLAEEHGWRVFYLGSSKFVSEKGKKVLQELFPDLCIETQDGFFSKEKHSAQNEAVLAKIAEFRPHILFVGMGMPVQEGWIEENFDALRANVVISSGATLDYFAGVLPMPPRWLSSIGFEWLYRLANEPRRLAFRYLAEPWYILRSVLQMNIAPKKRSKPHLVQIEP